MALYAATLGGMKTRIAAELARSDLTTAIENAINDAITVYQQQRFLFNESPLDAPSTFSTVANRAVYTSADNANIGTLQKIDYVLMNVGTATIFELVREDTKNLLLYNQQSGYMKGPPTWFSYRDGQLIFSPVPDQAYLMTLGILRTLAAPASDDEAGNPWMTTAEMLIRSRAKYEIAVHRTRNADMAQLMSPNSPEENGGVVGQAYLAWKTLKGSSNRAVARGRIRPMSF